VIIQLARNGIVEAITRAFKAESPSVSSILSIAPRASGLDNDGPRMIRSTISGRVRFVSGKPGIASIFNFNFCSTPRGPTQ